MGPPIAATEQGRGPEAEAALVGALVEARSPAPAEQRREGDVSDCAVCVLLDRYTPQGRRHHPAGCIAELIVEARAARAEGRREGIEAAARWILGHGTLGSPAIVAGDMRAALSAPATTVGEGPPDEGELVLQMERAVHVLAAISLKGGMRDPWLRERCSQASAVLKAVRFPDDPWPRCFDSMAERADRAAPPSPPKGVCRCGQLEPCSLHNPPLAERPRPESAEASLALLIPAHWERFSCHTCGAEWAGDPEAPRPPCPRCGGTGRTP